MEQNRREIVEYKGKKYKLVEAPEPEHECTGGCDFYNEIETDCMDFWCYKGMHYKEIKDNVIQKEKK